MLSSLKPSSHQMTYEENHHLFSVGSTSRGRAIAVRADERAERLIVVSLARQRGADGSCGPRQRRLGAKGCACAWRRAEAILARVLAETNVIAGPSTGNADLTVGIGRGGHG